jgi:hypothetical protein
LEKSIGILATINSIVATMPYNPDFAVVYCL